MSEDDDQARKIRAEKLRDQISRLKKPGEAADAKSDSTAQQPSAGPSEKSPRDFIREKMRELDEDEE